MLSPSSMQSLRRSISSVRYRPSSSLSSTTLSRRALQMSSEVSGSVEVSIRDKLTTLLQPSELIITNDSWQHRHHAAMRASGGGSGETHFSVNVVSDAFKGKSTIQRHRMIHSALSDEFAQGLHALSLKTKTTEEAQKVNSI